MQHRVHRFLIHDRVLPLGALVVEYRWQLLDDALARLCEHLILSLAGAGSGSWLEGESCAQNHISRVDG